MSTDSDRLRSVEELHGLAQKLRCDIVKMTTRAGSGHPSSSLSAIDVLTALYFGGILKYDPESSGWPDRDRVLLSKGHACPALYACLAEAGYFPTEQLWSLRETGSPLEGHPNMRRLPGVEASTGSLGQGLSLGVGHALAGRLDGRAFRTYVVLGDGECQEGQVWEAAMCAGNRGLDNLCAIVDANKYQQSGAVREINDLEPLAEKWRAFKWHALEIDGHDIKAILDALHEARATQNRPTVLVAHTVKGKGVSFVEQDWTYHGRPVKKEDLDAALKELQCR